MSSVGRVKQVPTKPFGEQTVFTLLNEPGIRNVITYCFVLFSYCRKFYRHMHTTIATHSNIILILSVLLSGLFNFSNTIVDILGGFHPLVEEPVQVYVSIFNNGFTKIFRVGMCKFPFLHIMLHGILEQCIT